MTITVTFDVWRAAVAVYLDRLGCPRELADMPDGLDRALYTWYGGGVRAYLVARVLAGMCWPGRVTLDADPLVPSRRRAVRLEMVEKGLIA